MPHATSERTVDARPTRNAAADPPPVLVVQGVVKRWPGHPEPVLDGLDLELGRGRLAAIAGPNGVGKTTLLRVITGVIAPDAGSVRLSGLDLDEDARGYKSRLGYLPAGNTGLFARLRVRRHLEYWARLTFTPKDERADKVERALDGFELRDLAERRADRLSMGQRQRLRVAMAFLHEPDLVLLDEPHSSLDAHSIGLVAGFLDALVARGGSALWCIPEGERPAADFHDHYSLRAGRLERT